MSEQQKRDLLAFAEKQIIDLDAAEAVLLDPAYSWREYISRDAYSSKQALANARHQLMGLSLSLKADLSVNYPAVVAS